MNATTTGRLHTPVVLDETDHRVLRVTLNKAAEHNRLSADLVKAITDALDRAETGEHTRFFVLDAIGPMFCAGADLGDPNDPRWRLDLAPARELLTRLRDSRLVTIAVVEGAAIGGGVGVAAACDQVIAGRKARFRLTEVLLGLLPAMVLPVLAERIGVHHAYTMALTAQEIDAPRAVHSGLVDRVADEPERELRTLLAGLGGASYSALRALKGYRAALWPASVEREQLITSVLAARGADPDLQSRLRRLHDEGLLS